MKKYAAFIASVIAYVFLCGASNLGSSFPLPLAKNAKAFPDKTELEVEKEKMEQKRIENSILLGTKDYDSLDVFSKNVMVSYEKGLINGDQFISQMNLVVPLVGMQAALPNIIIWTKTMPESYAAWYALARIFHQQPRSGFQKLDVRQTWRCDGNIGRVYSCNATIHLLSGARSPTPLFIIVPEQHFCAST